MWLSSESSLGKPFLKGFPGSPVPWVLKRWGGNVGDMRAPWEWGSPGVRASISQSCGVAAWMQGPDHARVPDLQRAVLLSPMVGQARTSCVHAEVVWEHLSLLPAGQQCLGLRSVSGQTHATVITHHPRAGTHIWAYHLEIDPRQPGMVQVTITQQAYPSVILSHQSLHSHLSYSYFSFPSFFPSHQGLKIGLEKRKFQDLWPQICILLKFPDGLFGKW